MENINKDLSSENLVIQNINNKSIYCRSTSSQLIQLSNTLENNYINKACKPKAMVCSAGMSAIRLTLHSLLMTLKKKIVIYPLISFMVQNYIVIL